MSAAHTPGPWRVDPIHSEDIQTSDGSLEIACVSAAVLIGGDTPTSQAGREANARLIAAAPELLEALVDVMFRHVPFSDKSAYAEKARAAIAKATGEQP